MSPWGTKAALRVATHHHDLVSLALTDNTFFLIGPASDTTFPALQAVNGQLFARLTWSTPLDERFDHKPAFRVASLPLPDVAASTLGRGVWSARLVAAVSALGHLHAHVLPIVLRVNKSRKEVPNAGFLVEPTAVARDWLDEDASDFESTANGRRIKVARRLVVRRNFVAPAPVFGVQGLGYIALSPAAARAAQALGLVGTWFEPISQYNNTRLVRYPTSDTALSPRP